MWEQQLKKKRFCLKEEKSCVNGTIMVIVDTKTGVGGSSITPLLDSNGNAVIDK